MFWFFTLNFRFEFFFSPFLYSKNYLLFNPTTNNNKKKIITEECISRPFGQPLCLVAEDSLAETPPTRKGIRKKK